MDTRAKITDSATINRKCSKLIVGYFDPLSADHTRRLQQLCEGEECIVVAVDDPPNPILPLRARQELVAALRCVHFVVSIGEIEHLRPYEIIDERPADLTRRETLMHHVVSKQATG